MEDFNRVLPFLICYVFCYEKPPDPVFRRASFSPGVPATLRRDPRVLRFPFVSSLWSLGFGVRVKGLGV